MALHVPVDATKDGRGGPARRVGIKAWLDEVATKSSAERDVPAPTRSRRRTRSIGSDAQLAARKSTKTAVDDLAARELVGEGEIHPIGVRIGRAAVEDAIGRDVIPTRSAPMAAIAASTTARAKRIRFSTEPPQPFGFAVR